MGRISFLIVLFIATACNESAVNQPKIGSNFKLDSLTIEEKSFLDKIASQNESLIISNQVERYFAGSDSLPAANKLVFPKHFLIDKGYVYLELEFYGEITDVNISYRYSLGQADTGYGSVSGNDTSDYVHTFKGCGVTACITQVYNNGKKILEKEDLR